MIAKNDMMGVLLNACPSFASRWQAFLEEWRGEGDDLPLYVALGDFARHLIGMQERGETDHLARVFQAIERIHKEGDLYVREAATVGLLEDLQNLNLHSRTRPEQFVPYLGEESARSWAGLNRFWSGMVDRAKPSPRNSHSVSED
jgi:hypothetical protein